jgi:hypothetical protein
VKQKSIEAVIEGGFEWLGVYWELILHVRLAPLTKIERLLCHKNHLLAVSAETPAKDLRRYWPEVSAWFEGVRFRVLENPH